MGLPGVQSVEGRGWGQREPQARRAQRNPCPLVGSLLTSRRHAGGAPSSLIRISWFDIIAILLNVAIYYFSLLFMRLSADRQEIAVVDDQDRWMTLAGVAQHLQLSRSKLYAMAQRGENSCPQSSGPVVLSPSRDPRLDDRLQVWSHARRYPGRARKASTEGEVEPCQSGFSNN